jgi:hypothetical protein
MKQITLFTLVFTEKLSIIPSTQLTLSFNIVVLKKRQSNLMEVNLGKQIDILIDSKKLNEAN